VIKAIIKAVLILLVLPFVLNAQAVLRNDLLKLEAQKRIEQMGQELQEKTGVSLYLIATNEHFKERYNLVAHAKQYEANMSKPYVLFIFAPYATITQKSEAKGRVGIIPSSDEIKSYYDADAVRDATINIIAVKDSNTDEDKFNVGVLQGYSELADEIATSKGVMLKSIIPDDIGVIVTILRVLVYSGTLILLWIFVLKPAYRRIKNDKH
jgi:hypothetical protein